MIEEVRVDGDTYFEVYLNNNQVRYRGYLVLHRMEDNEQSAIVLNKYMRDIFKDGKYQLVEDNRNFESRNVVIKYDAIDTIHVKYLAEEQRQSQSQP